MGANEIFACGSVLARRRVAFVDLVLAITSRVAFGADASVAVADVFALAAVATKFRNGPRSFAEGSVFTRHHLHVAEDSSPAGGASTLVRLVDLFASGPVETRALAGWNKSRVRNATHRTPVDEAFATSSSESVRAVAEIRSQSVAASGSVETRIRVAFVDAELAVGTRVAGRAEARVGVDTVDASPVVHARTGRAIFVVGLTVGAGEAQRTSASVRVDIVPTGGAIAAGTGSAFVHVRLAMFSSESIDAETRVLSDAVEASAAVFARESCAIVRVGQTVAAFVALGAEATVRSVRVLTGGSVTTR